MQEKTFDYSIGLFVGKGTGQFYLYATLDGGNYKWDFPPILPSYIRWEGVIKYHVEGGSPNYEDDEIIAPIIMEGNKV